MDMKYTFSTPTLSNIFQFRTFSIGLKTAREVFIIIKAMQDAKMLSLRDQRILKSTRVQEFYDKYWEKVNDSSVYAIKLVSINDSFHN